MPETAPILATPATEAPALSPARDRPRIDLYLAAFLSETRRRYAANPHVLPLYSKAAEFVLRGGKRLRPRLCLAGYRVVTGRFGPPPRAVWLAAASLEVFHAFMLVHDDLIDGSVVRRDRPTLHESIRLDGDEPDEPSARKAAADLGLIAGDLLCALGMRLLGRSGLDDASQGRAQRLVADMLLETGLGEALDVLYGGCPLGHLSEDQIVEAYLRKTARYSVSGPLVLGATIAGADPAVCRALDRFGDLLGFGYQVQNDLDALAEDPDRGDHPDLDAGKRTYVLWQAHRRLSEANRAALIDTLSEPPGPRRRRQLLALIHASGAVDACRDRLRSVRREAVEVLRIPAIDPAQRRAFASLMELFRLGEVAAPPHPGPDGAGMAEVPGLAAEAPAARWS